MIYADHAATTPLSPVALAAMLPWLQEHYGNPSSIHQAGLKARNAIEQARRTMAHCWGVAPETLTFTSGATEGINTLIRGLVQQYPIGGHVLTTVLEHAATTESLAWLTQKPDWQVTALAPTDLEGSFTPQQFVAALQPHTRLVTFLWGHNEIGTIQPAQAITAAVKAARPDVLVHVDMVQLVGKHAIDLDALGADFATWSAHKFYGPKGVGGLYARYPDLFVPLLHGGGQEHSRRGGTESVASIVGMAAALAEVTEAQERQIPRLQALGEQLWQALQSVCPEGIVLELNGPSDFTARVPGLVHVSVARAIPTSLQESEDFMIDGEAMVKQLDLRGVAASSGSACHNNADTGARIEPSAIIKALGKSDTLARSTVRFSLGYGSTSEDVTAIATAFGQMLARQVKRAIHESPLPRVPIT